jgi:replicative DNA helicase
MAIQTTADKVLQALQAYNLKKDGAEYRSNNPYHNGSDSHAFKLRIDHGERGTYYDHAHGDKGTLYDLARHFGIETPEGGVYAVESTKREYRNLDEYAKAHGVTGDVFRAADWREVIHQDRPALEFDTANGARYRFIDNGKEKYKSVYGYKPCWYHIGRAVKCARETGKPLILCNGEATTVVAEHFGLCAFSATAGEKALSPDLLETLLKAVNGGGFSAFWLALDCDSTGRDAARKIAEQLTGKDIRVKVVDLGLGDGGDLADFCKLFEHDALRELTARAETEKGTSERPAIERDSIADLAGAIKGLTAANVQNEQARNGMQEQALIAKAEAALEVAKSKYAKARTVSAADLTKQNIEAMRERRENPDRPRELDFGLRTVNGMVGEILPEIYTFYGATNMGKSTAMVSIAKRLVTLKPGLIVTTESVPNRWYNKLIARFTGIPSNKIEQAENLTDEDFQRIENYMEMLADFDINFLDKGNPNIFEIRAEALRLKPSWIIVDSMSKMEHPGCSNIYDITRGASNGLQSLMQELKIPILKTVQIGRDVENRPIGQKTPRLGDAYGGGVIEHNSGVIIGVYNHQYYVEQGLETPAPGKYPEGTTSLTLMKHRWNDGARVSRAIVENRPGVGYFDQGGTR